MKQKKLIIGLAAALVVLLAVFGTVFALTRPEASDTLKTVSVEIVYADKTEKNYEISTEAEYLADALYEKQLITDEEYKTGFYTVIDGITADYNADGAWWCITKDGQMTEVGMNEQPIADGDSFEITYTVG